VNTPAGRKVLTLILALGICLLASYIAAYYTTPSLGWYAGLIKPDLTPPAWIFAPVWSVLYIMMGLSLYTVLQSGFRNKDVKLGLAFFMFQLILNIAWSYTFFGLHSTFYGFISIVVLWVALLCTILMLLRFTVTGAALLLPYMFWVTFAAILNYLIMTMNPVSYGLSLT
jgi:tryptophan-rich sensory protein